MEITLTRPRCNSYNMTAVASTHTCVQLNRITPEDQTGTSPMELLLEAVAGCASIDVILILEEKGRASLTGYKVIASGRRYRCLCIKGHTSHRTISREVLFGGVNAQRQCGNYLFAYTQWRKNKVKCYDRISL